MSQTKPTEKKVVRINENDLVDLIDNIVSETVAKEKEKWINEQAAKNETILAEKVSQLESKLNKLLEAKK